MSEKNFDRYELGRKTSNDILENEKVEVDEIESMLFRKKNTNEPYKNKHNKFFETVNKKALGDDGSKLDAVKKVQMSVYSSNSSEILNSYSKSSVVFSFFAIIFMTLLFAVVIELIIISTAGYSLRIYNSDDLEGAVSQGEVLFEKPNKNLEFDIGTILTYEVGGENFTRVVTEMTSTSIIVDTPKGGEAKEILLNNIDIEVVSVVVSHIPPVGQIVYYTYTYWYYVCGVLALLSILFFVGKFVADHNYDNILIERLEYEKKEREKRKKYLSEDISKIQESKKYADGILDELLNVNKVPETKREKKMQRLQEQIQKRRMQQIESIKENAEKLQDEIKNTMGTKEERKLSDLEVEIKAKESGIASDIRKQVENESKGLNISVSQEEVEKRRKMAEEANKKIGDF